MIFRSCAPCSADRSSVEASSPALARPASHGFTNPPPDIDDSKCVVVVYKNVEKTLTMWKFLDVYGLNI